jgi:hypothetical protein
MSAEIGLLHTFNKSGINLRDWDNGRKSRDGILYAKVEIQFPPGKSQDQKLDEIEHVVDTLRGESTNPLPNYITILDRMQTANHPIRTVSLRLDRNDLIADRAFLFVLCDKQ